MKSLALYLALSLSALTIFAQQEQRIIGVNESHNENDTTRTFTIVHEDKDACREALFGLWGSPVKNEVGTVIWEDVSLDGISESVNIELSDGVFEVNRKKRTAKFEIFKNEDHKSKLLAEDSQRRMVVEFKNEENKNIAISQEREDYFRQLLEKALADI